MERQRPLDSTRRLLRVFGVKVTEYEERTAELLERAAVPSTRPEEMLRLAAEAIALTADLNARLRDITSHVLDTEGRVLAEVQARIAAQRE